jgi:hypothetical protein
VSNLVHPDPNFDPEDPEDPVCIIKDYVNDDCYAGVMPHPTM